MINIKRLVRPNILELQPYSSARDEFSGKNCVFLDANENPYGTLNRYPDPYQTELKQKLAELKGINLNRIFIGNGSDEVFDLAFRIFCCPGKDKALAFSPSYGMYDASSAINNIELIKIPLTHNFQIDLKEVTPLISDDSIKLIIVCSPNNPTGNLINKEDIEFMIKNFNAIVIIDEAYIDFTKADSLISLINHYNNVIVSQSFSKAWGLAAARVGAAYANPEIISLYNKVKPPYNVSKINVDAVLKALNDYKSYENTVSNILKEKERLIAELKQINLVKKIYPTDANFILIKVDDANGLYRNLIAHQIVIRNRNSLINNCLRISIGTPEENNELLYTLKKIR